MTIIARFSAKAFLEASRFCNHDTNMEAVACVRVEPSPGGGVYLAALDGYRFGMVHDKGSDSHPSHCPPGGLVLYPRADLLKACAWKPKGGKYQPTMSIVLDDTGSLSVEMVNGEKVYVSPEDIRRTYTYPDFWTLLTQAMDAARALGDKAPLSWQPTGKSGSVHVLLPESDMGSGAALFIPTGGTSPRLILVASRPDFIGVETPANVWSEWETLGHEIRARLEGWQRVMTVEPESFGWNG